VEANKDIFDSLAGIDQMMRGLGDSFINLLGLANEFGADLVSLRDTLTERLGGDGTKALALMQPQLQKLWEHQQKFHDITDEATLSLLNEAEQAGIVGPQFKDVMEKILQVLLAIAGALGASNSELDKLNGRRAEVNVHTNYTSSGSPPNPPGQYGFNYDGTPDNDGDKNNSYASGFGKSGGGNWKGGPGLIPRDEIWQVHKGEMAWIIPAGEWQRMGFRSAAAGFGGKGIDEGEWTPRERYTPFVEATSENGSFSGDSSLSDLSEATAETAAQVQSLAASVQSLAELVANQPTANISIPVTNAPTIQVRDESLVKTAESVQRFEEHTIGVIDLAIKKNARGLATRVEEIAERVFRRLNR
jgi:hypothetical protein